MGRFAGWITLALATVACGGRAHSDDRHRDLIALPDAGAGLAPDAGVPTATLPVLDAGGAELGAACGADGVVHHSVEVTRQEQLDQLAGCARIAGNLNLYARNFDLSPLLSLRVVEGRLWVDGEDAPPPGGRQEVLDGFRGLEQVGALTLLRVNVRNLAALRRLRRIGFGADDVRELALADDDQLGAFEVRLCANFADFSGLDSLEQVDAIELRSDPDLQRLSGMPRLQRVDRLEAMATPLVDLSGLGTFLQSLNLRSTALEHLTGLGNASRLRTLALSKNRSLTSLEGGTFPTQMHSLHSEDDGLVSLKGLENLRQANSIDIGKDPDLNRLETLAGLDGLVQVGTLVLQGMTRLSSLEGLSALQRADSINIDQANALQSLAGLSSLTQVDSLNLTAASLSDLRGFGALSANSVFVSNTLVSSLAGFENVSVQALYLYAASRLTTLNGLVPGEALKDLTMNDTPLLSDLGVLSGMTELRSLALTRTAVVNLDALVGLQKLGNLVLLDNARLSQIDAVHSVSDLVSLSVSGHPLLRELPSFDNVTGSGCADCGLFQLAIYGNPALEIGPRLPALQQAASIYFENNEALTELTGLSALRGVESVTITNNASLARVDLSALRSANYIRVRANPALDDGPLAGLRQMPGVSNVKIVSNRSGFAQLQPCPWPGDGECDEANGDCAFGSDSLDCR
jgi:hypothetical protein